MKFIVSKNVLNAAVESISDIPSTDQKDDAISRSIVIYADKEDSKVTVGAYVEHYNGLAGETFIYDEDVDIEESGSVMVFSAYLKSALSVQTGTNLLIETKKGDSNKKGDISLLIVDADSTLDTGVELALPELSDQIDDFVTRPGDVDETEAIKIIDVEGLEEAIETATATSAILQSNALYIDTHPEEKGTLIVGSFQARGQFSVVVPVKAENINKDDFEEIALNKDFLKVLISMLKHSSPESSVFMLPDADKKQVRFFSMIDGDPEFDIILPMVGKVAKVKSDMPGGQIENVLKLTEKIINNHESITFSIDSHKEFTNAIKNASKISSLGGFIVGDRTVGENLLFHLDEGVLTISTPKGAKYSSQITISHPDDQVFDWKDGLEFVIRPGLYQSLLTKPIFSADDTLEFNFTFASETRAPKVLAQVKDDKGILVNGSIVLVTAKKTSDF